MRVLVKGAAAMIVLATSLQPTVAAPQTATAKTVGTVKAISGNIITVSSDAAGEVRAEMQEGAKLVRVAPGQKDLKGATAITTAEVQVGDRVLIKGAMEGDGKTLAATSLIDLSATDVADIKKQQRDEWQKSGVGGLVTQIDGTAGTIAISSPSLGEKKTIAVHFTKDTVMRRYSPDSVKFDDAKVAPLQDLKAGDQLRARGTRSADGSELSATEIVSGTFRNLSGTIAAVDSGAGTISFQDLATKKAVVVKITGESQVRKLPPAIAQRIAMRLRGGSDAGAGTGSDGAGQGRGAGNTPGGKPAVTPVPPSDISQRRGNGGNGGGAGGEGGGARTPDLQQAISRMPAASLTDLQKGDAIMVVSTQGGDGGVPTAITLLAGVEPILQASPKAATILTPWSLGGAPGGDSGGQ